MDDSPEDILETALTDLFRVAFSRRFYERQVTLAKVPLTRTGMDALIRLQDHGPMSVSALSVALEMSMPTASRQLRQLEDLGYATRRPDPDDARAAIYTVSLKGRHAIRRMRDVRYRLLVEALSHWEDDDRVLVAELLRRLVHDMRTAGTAAAGRGPAPGRR